MPAEELNDGDLPAVTLTRPLGAFERVLYRFAERNPLNLSLVAEFDQRLDETQVRCALSAVQSRHPLLGVLVVDAPNAPHPIAFYRADDVPAIPLAFRHNEVDQWEKVLADERSKLFDRTRAPLVRAVLLADAVRSVVIVTVDHTVADGISCVTIIDDLVAALNGNELMPLPVPKAVEDVFSERHDSDSYEAIDMADLYTDPRMQTPTTNRPFDGSPPEIRSLAMSSSETARLVERCRAHETTVHAALVVAAGSVTARRRGQNFARVMSPINIRELLDVHGDCADYFTGASTGVALDEGPFWNQARAIAGQLNFARSAAGVAAGSVAMQQTVPVRATSTEAERFFTEVMPFDVVITNLGIQELTDSGPIAPAAIWGPAVQMHIAGEYVIGVVTYGNRLRMTVCSHGSVALYLEEVRSELMAQT